MQEVTLPDGRRWTVRVERNNEPVVPSNMFGLNLWYGRWLLSRLVFALRPEEAKRWRVVVVPDAVLSSDRMAMLSTAMPGVMPAIGSPIWQQVLPSRTAAEDRAAEIFHALNRGVDLP